MALCVCVCVCVSVPVSVCLYSLHRQHTEGLGEGKRKTNCAAKLIALPNR